MDNLFEQHEARTKVEATISLRQRLDAGEDVFSEFCDAIDALSDLEAREYANRRVELGL